MNAVELRRSSQARARRLLAGAACSSVIFGFIACGSAEQHRQSMRQHAYAGEGAGGYIAGAPGSDTETASGGENASGAAQGGAGGDAGNASLAGNESGGEAGSGGEGGLFNGGGSGGTTGGGTAGSSGGDQGGMAGVAGTAGTVGTAGAEQGGSAGTTGNAGSGGTAGTGGDQGGTAGTGGDQAGTAGTGGDQAGAAGAGAQGGAAGSAGAGGASGGGGGGPVDPVCGLNLARVGTYSQWCGKVNVHQDSNGNWLTDTDCTSGCRTTAPTRLAYCQKFYPTTTAIVAVDQNASGFKDWKNKNCIDSLPDGPGVDGEYACCAPLQ